MVVGGKGAAELGLAPMGGPEIPASDSTRRRMERWNGGWHTLFATLEKLSDENLFGVVTIRGEKFRAHEALHRLLAHTSYHVGQIVFLAKHIKGAGWKTLSIPKGKSEEYLRVKV